jgi:N-acyl-D-amino-acid deacylase
MSFAARRIPGAALAACVSYALISAAAAQQPASTLIRGVAIIDGSGSPARVGDVRIVGDRIIEFGQITSTSADVVIEARGFSLAPGFIDSHSHHDHGMESARDALPMVSQGVTTIVVGQDGAGRGLDSLFRRLDAQPAAVNIASYAGHGCIRAAVLGNDFRRAAIADEIDRMKALLRDEMNAGALGLSTGLEYDPGIYSTPDEVLALARVAFAMGGRYISHIRSEDRDLWKAIDEVITIGRVTGIPVQVSHIKLSMSDLWGQANRVIRVLDMARASGVQITADVYPYTHWQSNLGVFYPARNFADRAETEFVLSHLTPADEIIFSDGFPGHSEYAGKTLVQIARMRMASTVQTMMDLLAENGGPDATIVAKGMSDVDVEMLIRWPFANVGSDGFSTGAHPRGWGSFARVLGPFVRVKRLFSLEEAVRKMSGLTASTLGLTNRGLIKPGYFADLVLFDQETVSDRSTFEMPQAQAVGVWTVWVNGQIVFDRGITTGRYPGRPLRRERR